MLPPVVELLPAPSRNRFHAAYNDRNKPLAWGEHDDLAVGLLQAWLRFLGFNLPKSTKISPDGSIEADGIFWDETRQAVIDFQRTNHLRVDGLVGHDTLDSIAANLSRRNAPPPMTHHSTVFVKKPNEVQRPRRCPPGALICPDQ
jgi:peptidoglycan hydrolase-like protein with peptidoglycan-binding domain